MLNPTSLSNIQTEQFYKVLLLGESKTGKTTAFQTFPKPALAIGLTPRTRAALIGTPIDLIEIFEQQPKSSKSFGSNEYSITPRAWDELWTTIEDLWDLAHSDKPFPYKSIMLDDLTTANDIAMNHVLSLRKKDGTEVPKGLAGAPAQAHYMPQMALMSRLINSLFLTLPCHILVCGHMSFKENEDTGISAYFPKVYGSLRESIASWFDEVYETKIENLTTRVRPIPGQKPSPSPDEPTPTSRYVWITRGYGQKQFLGSTLNHNNIFPSPFHVDLSQNVSGFSKILQLKGGTMK